MERAEAGVGVVKLPAEQKRIQKAEGD